MWLSEPFPFLFALKPVMLSLQSWISNLFLLISSILQTPIDENIHDTENELLRSQAQNPPCGSDHKKTLVQKEQTRLLQIWSHKLSLNIEGVRLSRQWKLPSPRNVNQQLIQYSFQQTLHVFFLNGGNKYNLKFSKIDNPIYILYHLKSIHCCYLPKLRFVSKLESLHGFHYYAYF